MTCFALIRSYNLCYSPGLQYLFCQQKQMKGMSSDRSLRAQLSSHNAMGRGTFVSIRSLYSLCMDAIPQNLLCVEYWETSALKCKYVMQLQTIMHAATLERQKISNGMCIYKVSQHFMQIHSKGVHRWAYCCKDNSQSKHQKHPQISSFGWHLYSHWQLAPFKGDVSSENYPLCQSRFQVEHFFIEFLVFFLFFIFYISIY